MTAQEKAAEVLDEHYDGDRGPGLGAGVLRVLRDHGLVVVHDGDHTDRAIVLDRTDEALRAAVRAQLEDRDPHHQDLYAWGWLLTAVVERAEDVARVLAEQLNDYGQRHQLRDDAGMPPGERIDQAVTELDAFIGYLRGAREHAARYHSAASHIAVQQPPEDDEGGEPT